ncbi:FAD/NAD(P)-binding domain-containing protein [Neurospora crassa]|nr:FAD/NAD(P)-binding domain-containing protein [Neurospora crassa]
MTLPSQSFTCLLRQVTALFDNINTHLMMDPDSALDSEVEVDVAIVGAGLSGLRAAVELHKAGLTIAVLEESNRVGGQCCTTFARHTTRITSIGDTHTEMLSLAKDFNIDLTKQHREGLSLQQRYDFFKDSPQVSETIPALETTVWPPQEYQLSFRSLIEDPAIQKFYRRISDLSETWHGPDALFLDAVSFLELVEANFFHSKAVHQEAYFLTSYLLGVAPARVSALYVLDHIASGGGLANLYFHPDSPGGGAHHFRVPQGQQAFIANLVGLLPEGCIHLSTIVTKITQQTSPISKIYYPPHPCKVETSPPSGTDSTASITAKTFYAKKVLLAASPAFYSPLWTHLPKAITFHPPLPPHKTTAINRHSGHSGHRGVFTAVTFYFTQPWWRDAGLSGSMDCRVTRDLDGPISWVRDTSEEGGGKKKVWSLTCWCTAENGYEVWSWTSNTYSMDDDEPEEMKGGWEANPVWMHLLRVFKERMDALEMKIPLPRKGSLNWKEEEKEKEGEEGAGPPMAYNVRWWIGMGVTPPRELPSDGEELEELLRTWKYDGPGKGDAKMREPFRNVHFAGTETAEEWRGFMEGAARSGLRGAKEIIQALKKGNLKDGEDVKNEVLKALLTLDLLEMKFAVANWCWKPPPPHHGTTGSAG